METSEVWLLGYLAAIAGGKDTGEAVVIGDATAQAYRVRWPAREGNTFDGNTRGADDDDADHPVGN